MKSFNTSLEVLKRISNVKQKLFQWIRYVDKGNSFWDAIYKRYITYDVLDV